MAGLPGAVGSIDTSALEGKHAEVAVIAMAANRVTSVWFISGRPAIGSED
jgi:hypothetical protein